MSSAPVPASAGSHLAARTGGQVLIDQLVIHGVDHVFGVPGESYLAALDALHDARNAIKFVICRQEGGAANMAEAYGKLTGRPGVCFVTRGPGATNASIGVHTGFQDSTPMVVLVGQVARDQEEREAFQEIDYRRMFGPMTKWVAQIEDARRIPELISQAFHRAMSGRPGPVVLALPEDMLTDIVEVPDAPHYKTVRGAPDPEDMGRLRTLLEEASDPIVLLGGGGWTVKATEDIRDFIEANELPVATAFRNADLIDNRHPHYLGNLSSSASAYLQERILKCDLVLAIGPRLGEQTTRGYALFDVPVPKQSLIHVHGGADELGRVYHATLPINSGMAQFARAAKAMKPVGRRPWAARVKEGNDAYLESIAPMPPRSAVDMVAIVRWLNERLPADALISNGAGNYSGWVSRFFQYRGMRSQLAPTSGAMGYGVPAGVAAKIVQPNRMVVTFAGDGCFLMNGQEFATAVQYGADVIVVVVDNSMYGTIRMHQEREYPTRTIGTELRNPDFATYARAFGGHGETVVKTDEFAPAFERCVASKMPSIIHVKMDPDDVSPRTTLSQVREAALKRMKK